ncbi:MAG: DUF4159 domain-containing protein [Pseudomonadota bacterium]
MFGLPLAFAAPAVLTGLLALPLIWLLLRLTPPKPQEEVFPPLAILEQLERQEETPHRSPWWLTALRILLAALAILALAGPVLNPQTVLTGQADGDLMIIVDDGWASQTVWDQQVAAASALIRDGADQGRPVRLAFTSQGTSANLDSDTPDLLIERLGAATPKPIVSELNALADKMMAELPSPSEIVFLGGTIAPGGWNVGLEQLAQEGHNLRALRLAEPSATAIVGLTNNNDGLVINLATLGGFPTSRLLALDDRGRPLAEVELSAAEPLGEGRLSVSFDMPLELRNDVQRIALEANTNAGEVFVTDSGAQRRRVAMLSGVANELAQPLLEPLHYISRALADTSEVRLAQEANLVSEIERLLADRPSVFVLADVGTLPEAATEQLSIFVNNGGTLLRFAGPRLAAGDFQDPLIPVLLREGERALGGSLSWDEPQPIAPFSGDSPFVGISLSDKIEVRRQVLAQPDVDLSSRTWASLADGTPLVTASPFGNGELVLFHVTADATWSNLPLSGTFVAMLNRVVERSRGTGLSGTAEMGEAVVLPPLRTVRADGAFGLPTAQTRPLTANPGEVLRAQLGNPPGLYGTRQAALALNLYDEARDGEVALSAVTVPDTVPTMRVDVYPQSEARDLAPWLFLAAFMLLAIDTIVMLTMMGAVDKAKRLRGAKAITPGLLVGAVGLAILTLQIPSAQAQTDAEQASFEKTLPAAFETRVGYILTGDLRVDEVSKQGMEGMSRFVASRTSLEPGPPIALDPEIDEMSFFPLIYWPITADAEMPSPTALARIDAYMKNGGTVLFDTRNGLPENFSVRGGQTPSEARLAAILESLDIPPLEPVPPDHVLTKSFYLLDNFPGRFANSPLWVEALPIPVEGAPRRPARAGDGVSSIMISGNDLAGAWALDEAGRPLLPTEPQNSRQRILAFRVGVNIMMYTLTGNYKADQIHIPDLLERLGQ